MRIFLSGIIQDRCRRSKDIHTQDYRSALSDVLLPPCAHR